MNTNQILQSLEYLSPRSLKVLASNISVLVEQKLWAKILTDMILGLSFGYLISPVGLFSESLADHASHINILVNWLALPAKFFLKLIQMVIVPLIIASVIRGLASTDDRSQMKSLGIKFGVFVLITSALSSVLGIAISLILKPGRFLDLNLSLINNSGTDLNLQGITPETFLKLIPINPLESIVQKQMMDVVIIAIIGGIALLSVEVKQTRIVLDILEVVQNVCMTIIAWAMKIAPYAIFGMMTSVAASTGLKALQSMGFYLLTVYAGFIIFILFY